MTLIDALTSLLALVFGGFLFWVKRWIDKIDKDMNEIKNTYERKIGESIDRFTVIAEKLETGINSLNTAVEVFKTETQSKSGELERRINGKQKWLEKHNEELKDHEKRISKIEAKHE